MSFEIYPAGAALYLPAGVLVFGSTRPLRVGCGSVVLETYAGNTSRYEISSLEVFPTFSVSRGDRARLHPQAAPACAR